MEKKPLIAIWSPLRYVNYGDDLQAIAYGLYLKELGYDVKLFQLDKELSDMYDLPSVETVDELCKDVKLCVIAGGALLTPFNFLKRWLNKAAFDYEKDFKHLLQASRKYPVKFCAISMGGDGKTRNPFLYYSKSRIDFFSSDAFLDGTVRLEGDIAQMKKFGKNFVYYPDMLFRVKDYFEFEPLPQTQKFRVGLNLKKGKYLDEKLLESIYEYAGSNDDIEFYFTTTHMEKAGLNYQYVPERETNNIKIARYTSPKQLLSVLGSMDIFISSMLHVGLTGLTLGTPVLSYRGPGKTKSFLKSIGGDWAILDDNISFQELKSQFFSRSREELYSLYNIEAIDAMIKASNNQFEFCRKIAEKYA